MGISNLIQSLFRGEQNSKQTDATLINDSTGSLSKRGVRASETVLRSDFALFFEAKNDLYHPERNPNGKFPVNIAENNLSWIDMDKKIKEVMITKSIPEWVPSYTGLGGSDEFLNALSQFLSTILIKEKIDPGTLLASAGATAVIELASWILCSDGDVAVIPAPSYPVYTQDISNKPQVERYDLITHYNLDELGDTLPLSIDHLEKAKLEIEAKGKKFRMLIITTPDNPTGGMYSTDQLEGISEWCINYQIHLLINELYGLSIINTKHPDIAGDYTTDLDFTSFGKQMSLRKSEYVHLCYGLSKDLGISGFRVGIIHSYNERFLAAYANLNASHLVSNLTQWVMSEVLSDSAFMNQYLSDNRTRLTDNYVVVINTLRSLGIPYIPARGSLFVWLDLSIHLGGQTKEAEHNLWLDIYDKTGILLTPGEGFGHSKRGQFRLVYSFLQREVLEGAMGKLARYVKIRAKLS